MTTWVSRAFLAVAVCGWLPVSATIVGTGLIQQPTYLGKASQPDRIPLSPVIFNANHGYHSHSAIFQSRPCFHGHFQGGARPEYEQNLAVLFGISCELSDPTQMPGCTATFAIRQAQPPSNAPYTQEQVLAASLQTLLLHSWGMSKTHPLTVEIKGEGIPKPAWAAQYEGPYFYPDDDGLRDGTHSQPLGVRGIRIDATSVPGVVYLVLAGVAPDPAIQPMLPVFVPFQPEGECESGDVELVPLWPGDSWPAPLGVLTRPQLPYYEKWHSGAYGQFTESDAMPHQTPPNPTLADTRLVLSDGGTSCTVRLVGGEMTAEGFSALLCACVASVRPTAERPLIVVLENLGLAKDYQRLLADDPAWRDGKSCEFVMDARTMKLAKGSVPGFEMKLERGAIRVALARPEEEMFYEEDPAPPWIVGDLVKIRRDLPAVSRDDYRKVSAAYQTKLREWTREGRGDRDEILRILLAIAYYENNPLLFDSVWWCASDRVVRAVSGYLAGTGTDLRLPYPDFGSWFDWAQYERWVREQRQEEISYPVRSRVQSAVLEWRKRCDERNAKAAPDAGE